MAQPADLINLLPMQLEELTNALAATYDGSSTSSSSSMQNLAAAREQFMDTCSKLTDQLAQLRQAVNLSHQQTGQQQQQKQQTQAAAAKAAPSSATAPDAMDVDSQQEQPPAQEQKAPAEIAAIMTEQHAKFLSALTDCR